MTTRAPSVAYDAGAGQYERKGVLASWADDGGPARIPLALSRKTVAILGTFNGGTVTLQYSMDGSNFHTAQDIGGSDIATNAAAEFEVRSLAPFYRVSNDAQGTSEDIAVYLAAAAGA